MHNSWQPKPSHRTNVEEERINDFGEYPKHPSIRPSQPSLLPSGHSCNNSKTQRHPSLTWSSSSSSSSSSSEMIDPPPVSAQSRSTASSIVISHSHGANSDDAKASSENSTDSGPPLLKEHDYIGLAEVSSAAVQSLVTEESASSGSQPRSLNLNLEEADLRLGLGLPEGLNLSALVADDDSCPAVRTASDKSPHVMLHLLYKDLPSFQSADVEAGKGLTQPQASKLAKQSFGLGETVLHEIPSHDWAKIDGQLERQVDTRTLQELSHPHWIGREVRFTSEDNTFDDKTAATVSDLSPSQNLWQAQIFHNVERLYPSMELPSSGQDLELTRSSIRGGFSGTRVSLPGTKNGNKRGYLEAMADTRFDPGNFRNGIYGGVLTQGGKDVLQLSEMDITGRPPPSFVCNWESVKPPGVSSRQVGSELSRQSFGPFMSVPNQPAAMCSAHLNAIANRASRGSLSTDQEPVKSAGVQSQHGMVDVQQTLTNDDPPQKDQVVGWPPIRSFRKTTLASHPKHVEDEEGLVDSPWSTTASAALGSTQNTLFVKVNMDGVPIGRKVDLNACSSYEGLYHALEEMFQLSSGGQRGSSITHSKQNSSNTSIHLQLFSGSDYVLTYEDKEGDWMLVGDVPWGMFVSTVRRLRIMKSSEATGLAPRGAEKSKFRS